MSRRSLHWKTHVRRAGSIDKVIPRAANGTGEYLTKAEWLESPPKQGTGKGTTCTIPMSTRKEQLVRSWAK